jgi:ribosomal protein S18 acetylase RimI-like enzyme
MEFLIRRFEEKDEDDVVELWRRCNLIVPWNDPHVDVRKKMAFQRELFFVGTVNDKVVGSIMAGYDGHRGWIYYMGVDPDHEGRGFGRKLMDRALDELKGLGCYKVNLQVRESNTKVIEFYKRLGFEDDHVLGLGKRL